MVQPAEQEIDAGVELPPLGVWLRHAAKGLIVLCLAAVALSALLRGPLTTFATAFTAKFGLVGVFFGVLIIDVTPPLTNEPLLLAGQAGGLGFWPVLIVGTTASVLAGPLGWLIGRYVGRWQPIQNLFARYQIHAFLHRYGLWTIAFGAMPSPLPFAVTTLASGAVHLPLRTVVLGSLFRIPKCLITFSLVVFAWDLGALIS